MDSSRKSTKHPNATMQSKHQLMHQCRNQRSFKTKHIGMMESRKFTIQAIKSSKGRYTGRCIELPAAISKGDTIEQLETNMKKAVQLVLESIKEKTKHDNK